MGGGSVGEAPALVPLWTAITEGSQALSAPLLAPASSTAARRGEPVGEVLMRLKFAVVPRAAAAAAAPQQQLHDLITRAGTAVECSKLPKTVLKLCLTYRAHQLLMQ